MSFVWSAACHLLSQPWVPLISRTAKKKGNAAFCSIVINDCLSLALSFQWVIQNHSDMSLNLEDVLYLGNHCHFFIG